MEGGGKEGGEGCGQTKENDIDKSALVEAAQLSEGGGVTAL